MIVGVGIDVVEIARFEQALIRTEGLAARLFTDGERTLPPHSLASSVSCFSFSLKAVSSTFFALACGFWAVWPD